MLEMNNNSVPLICKINTVGEKNNSIDFHKCKFAVLWNTGEGTCLFVFLLQLYSGEI